MDREEAMKLLREYTKNENLVKHALAVEAAMRAYARRFGEDEELWGLTGLLHDFDYEKYPEEHPLKGAQILEELGYPEELVHAVRAHADFTGIKRESLLDRTLFAVDDLTGFLVAAALVQPNKTLAEVKVSSVRKKMKDKSFARKVNREDIVKGAEELGVDLDEHIGFVLEAMREIADRLGL
ncbi:TPA: HDIG domain-containing protein [Candidatus Bipolaricaulota bacterium]|nr:HDIG domain-containing protein [Candidatus Bipolaricaulota bacterium]